MRKTRTTFLAGAAALMLAGTAQAADEVNRMQVELPDGSVAHVEYVGEVAPRVTVRRAEPFGLIAFDRLAGFERIAAMMEARRQEMLRQFAALELAARQATLASPGGTTLVGTLPAGIRYTMVSSTTDANGCTRTVRYSSDGAGAAPQITRASAGTCDAGQSAPAVVEASASAPAEAPGHEV